MAFKVSLKLSVGTLQLLDQQQERTGDTHDVIIHRALQQIIKLTANKMVIEFDDPEKPGDLRHTSVQSMEIDGVRIQNQNPTWGSLLVEALKAASKNKKYPKDLEKLKEMTGAYIYDEKEYAKYEEKTENEGKPLAYKLEDSLGFYIKKAEAGRSWQQALKTAKSFGMPISVDFEWRKNKHAAHTKGTRGKLEWSPKKDIT